MQIEDAIGIWRCLKDYIPAKDKQVAAEQFVVTLIDSDASDEDLWALAEVDHYLEDAVKENFGDFSPEDEETDSEWD
jgi:uncharacterized protein HemX